MIDGTRIQTYQDNLANGRDPFYVAPPAPRDCYIRRTNKGTYPKCDHAETIDKRKKAKGIPKYLRCQNRTCCTCCEARFDCADVCSTMKSSIEKHKASETYRIGSALRAARISKGMSLEDAAKVLNLSHSQMLGYETNQMHTAASLTRLCKLYDTTPNEILGFLSNESSKQQCLSSWIPSDQVGDLPDGLYFMLYEYEKPYICENGKPLVQERAVMRKKSQWYLTPGGKTWNALYSDEKLVAILPAPPIPEGWSLMLAPMEMETEELEIVAEDVYDV